MILARLRKASCLISADTIKKLQEQLLLQNGICLVQAMILTIYLILGQTMFAGDLTDRLIGGHAFIDAAADVLLDQRHRLGQIRFLFFLLSGHDDDHLTFERIAHVEHFADPAADKFLVFLGQFPR